MREIKCRAWDKIRKRFFYASFNPTHIAWASPDYANQTLLRHKEPTEDCSNVEGVGFLDIEGWQQFTGLKDKNDKEIYEGDIVYYEDDGSDFPNILKICKAVEWVNVGWNLNSKLISYEIIGNIYENTELLEVVK